MANPIASLHRAITTASNDDVSTIGSGERSRHVKRIDAMQGAVEEIERLRAALIPFAAKVNGEAMMDPQNQHRAGVHGRADNDAYRNAWAAINAAQKEDLK